MLVKSATKGIEILHGCVQQANSFESKLRNTTSRILTVNCKFSMVQCVKFKEVFQ